MGLFLNHTVEVTTHGLFSVDDVVSIFYLFVAWLYGHKVVNTTLFSTFVFNFCMSCAIGDSNAYQANEVRCRQEDRLFSRVLWFRL